jgi:hypothetical protein
MKIYNFIILLIFGLPLHHAGQTTIATFPIKKIDGVFSSFHVDELGNLFAITTTGQIKKYNTSIDSLGIFNELRRYGAVHSISTGNPLRTTLYFKGYKTILVIDRLMQIINKVDLRKNQLLQVNAVSQSYDNRIWIFDEQDYKIKKLDLDGSILFESSDMRLVFSEAIQPSVIFECNGMLYLYDLKRGLYGFDYYGAFKSKVALLGWLDIHVVGNMIVGLKEGKLMAYGFTPPVIKEFILPENLSNYKQLHFDYDKGFGLTDTGIDVFKLNYK